VLQKPPAFYLPFALLLLKPPHPLVTDWASNLSPVKIILTF